MKLSEKIRNYVYLIFGIAIIALGIIIFVGSIKMYSWVIYLLTYVFLLYGVARLIGYIFNKRVVRNRQTLLTIVLNIVIGIILIFFKNIPLSILPISFSLYMLFNCASRFVNYSIQLSLNLKSRFKEFIMGLFFLVLSLIFLLSPLKSIHLLILIMSIYCILLGMSLIGEFIFEILDKKTKYNPKKKYRMTFPFFVDAFIPILGLNAIEKKKSKEKSKKGDISVFIHLSNHGMNQFGHVDVEINNKIYSYGNYDKSSQKLFTGVGDGVLTETMTKYEYINYCIFNSRKTIVEYEIKLNDDQKNEINNRLNDIKKYAVKWEPDAAKDKNSVYKDYSSKLYKATKTNFYKFSKGRYKTYFVVGTNCTYLANELLQNNIFEILKLVGIITPGTYYEYLEENYRLGKLNIVGKVIYNKDNIGQYLERK